MQLPESLTTVTPLSKKIALIMFIALPIISFQFGMYYQALLSDPFGDGSSLQSTIESESQGKKFEGVITSIDYGCHRDGMCSVSVGKGSVIVDTGESLTSKAPKGQVPFGLLDEAKTSQFVGKGVSVFAQNETGKSDMYTLIGNKEYYIKLKNLK